MRVKTRIEERGNKWEDAVHRLSEWEGKRSIW